MITPFRHLQPPLSPTLFLLLLLTASLRPPLAAAQPTYRPQTRPSPYIGVTFLLFAALIISTAIFFYFIRERCRPRRPTTPGSTFAAFHSGGPGRGLDPAAVEALPELTYSAAKAEMRMSVGLECAVCLNAFEEHETLRLMPKCGHAFHPDCVGVWLAAHTTCPCCRADLLSPPASDSPSSSISKDEREAPTDVVIDVDAAGEEGGRRSRRPSADEVAMHERPVNGT